MRAPFASLRGCWCSKVDLHRADCPSGISSAQSPNSTRLSVSRNTACESDAKAKERHALSRRKAVFAIQNHAVAVILSRTTVAQETLGLTLVHHQVSIRDVDRDLDPFAANCIESVGLYRGSAHPQLDGWQISPDSTPSKIARDSLCRNCCGQGTKKVAQSFEAEKVDGFVGDLEPRIGIAFQGWPDRPPGEPGRQSYLGRLLRIDEKSSEGVANFFP